MSDIKKSAWYQEALKSPWFTHNHLAVFGIREMKPYIPPPLPSTPAPGTSIDNTSDEVRYSIKLQARSARLASAT